MAMACILLFFGWVMKAFWMTVSLLDAVFRPLAPALELRAYRQGLLAANIANADTPNYKARDLDFARTLAAERNGGGGTLALRRTQPGQLPGLGTNPEAAFVGYRTGQAMGIDGNNVDLAQAEARFSANALAYEADLTFLIGRIKTLRLAIRGS